ncbi:glycosyltransferase family 4 protein [Vibrio cyclitrophicus]|uniref:glycosyltransferase family 4 protein n=2 Tax=Vibrio TaxID=662 RepID=UPI00031AE13C|nr:glycosyltransferase family 4 protein [Vibrio cyclitrophicus]OCH48067.1 hypothetical protein A6D96_15075 [Vibrio cyclitrophicus]
MGKSKVFFIGPGSGKITGQNKVLIDSVNAIENSILFSNGGEGESLLNKLWLFLSSLFTFSVNLIVTNNISVLSSSRSYSGFIKDLPFLVLSLLFSKKVIVHAHGNDFDNIFQSKNSIINKLSRWLYKKTDLILIPNSHMALQFENAGIENKKIKVLKNYCELVQVNRELKPGKRLLFLSNITVEKGVFDAIALFEKIKKKHPDSTLDIAGSSFLTDVQMQLFQSKVNDIDGVVYHGSIQGELKENILEKSDILIFPSKYKTEASPLVLLEAMSYGLAVVLYKHNNIEEVLPSQDYAIENYSFKSMVLKTNRLLKDSDIQTKYRVECLKESKKYTFNYYEKSFNGYIYEE